MDMDWETLLGFLGLYIMVIILFAHHFRIHLKIAELNKTILKISTTNQKIMQVVKDMVAEDIEERENTKIEL